MTQDLLKCLREAGNDYTVAWGTGELYDEAADEIELLTAELERIRNGIATDRCDGDSEWAAGVNAACQNHLQLVGRIWRAGHCRREPSFVVSVDYLMDQRGKTYQVNISRSDRPKDAQPGQGVMCVYETPTLANAAVTAEEWADFLNSAAGVAPTPERLCGEPEEEYLGRIAGVSGLDGETLCGQPPMKV